ncbi:hypothetical protein B0J13DRAFT_453815 [Dactylonectria estremocensis]|uniref:Rhodopsin domain-containing protein n=1 Tax=Dactylonectria estremocensis TaxID=1079267 RepID=A0A9P9DX21_9HYPO|nr:hypothetical protein B0J13DRAFT_453815 [Dactylonectria estremocensis]
MAEINGTLVAIAPPEGYVVDFDNPQRNSVAATYAVSSIGIIAAFLFLLQRLYVKAFIRNKLGIDDALLVVAWLGSIAIQVLTLRSFIEGWMGVHAWEIPFDKFQTAIFWATYINSIVYTVPTCLSKIVILLFLLELSGSQNWYRWTVFASMGIVAGTGIGIFFASVFPCTPFRKSWDLAIPADEGSCIDRPAMFQATAGLGVATDIIMIAIPIPMVVALQLSAKKKAALLCLFSIGSATVITSMVRLALLVTQLEEADTTWGGGPIHTWICIEANLLIMCACLSTLRHFIKTVAPRLLSSSKGTGTGKSKTGLSSGHELRTIGGTGGRSANRGPYTQFDEPFSTSTRAVGGGYEWNGGKSGGSIDGKSTQDDGGSDKGILQTTTTRVYYENAHAV